MSFLLMADWSDPGTTVITGVDVVAWYLGGSTPHVWTTTQINAQTVPRMMPIWVYPGSGNGTTEGQRAVSALQALGVPTGVRIALDMEAVVNQAFCVAFRNVIANAGYWTTIYGSASVLFGNWPDASGPGGGWWVADWTFSPFIYSHTGTWATQYTDGTNNTAGPWDESTVTNLNHLWQHKAITYSLTATAKDTATSQIGSQTASFTVS